MLAQLVELPLLAGLKVSLRLLREIVNSAPHDAQEALEDKWRENSMCWAVIQRADEKTRDADDDTRATFEEVKAYWLEERATLSERTRSITTLRFSMVALPFLTRPLRRLFAGETTIRPEATLTPK
jgi:hypothetical protein